MKHEIKQRENATVDLVLDFDRKEVENTRRPLFRTYQNQLRINGFRKGHIPYQMAQRILGKDFLDQDLVEKLIDDNIEDVLKELNMTMESRPRIKDYSYDDNGSLNIELEFATSPEVEIEDIGTIFTDSEGLESFDESEEFKNQLFENRKKSLLVELADKEATGKPIEKGNLITLELSGTTKKNRYPLHYSFIIGEDDQYFPEEVQQELIGLEIDDKIEVSLDEEPLTVEVFNIESVNEPEYNEDFITNNFFFDSVDEFEEFLKNQALNEHLNQLVYKNGQKQFDKLLDKTKVTFSPLYIEEISQGLNPDLVELLNLTDEDFSKADNKIDAFLDYQKKSELGHYLTNMGLVRDDYRSKLNYYQFKNNSTKNLNQVERKPEKDYVEGNDLLLNEVVKSLGSLNFMLSKQNTEEEKIDA